MAITLILPNIINKDLQTAATYGMPQQVIDELIQESILMCITANLVKPLSNANKNI